MAVLRLSVHLTLLLWHALARTNKGTVQQNIRNQWGYVIWGDHIDHDDYLRGIAAVASDFVCTGSCGFTYRYFEDLLDRQIEAFTSSEQWKRVGMNFIRQLARNPDTIRSIVAGNAFIKGTVGVASYNHWTDECRFCKPCTWCTPRFNCNDCGTYRVPRPNTHQPYFAFTVRAQTKEYKFSLTNSCNKEVQVALRYLPTGGSWTTLCWYSIRPGDSITPATGGKTLRTTNSVWYFYAEASDRSVWWKGTDNTRTCRGRSLGMQKMTQVSGSQLTLRLTCNNRRMLGETGETEMESLSVIPEQELCQLGEDRLEGAIDDKDVLDVLAFPNLDEEEGVGAPLCAETNSTKDILGVAFSQDGITLEGLSKRTIPPGKTANQSGEVTAPSCDETCVAIEEAFESLKEKLEKIHGRRLGEHLV